MPLQIRRGTETQRQAMTQPLAIGELLYVTNTGALYIGDGETLGGNPTVNLTPEDVKTYTAEMFTGGTHTGITYTFEDFLINSSVDLSGYSGVITASEYASDIIPTVDSAYDLGSATKKFKDLYLSGSSLYLGDAVITSSGSIIDLPAGSTINGVDIGTGGGGVIEGSTYKINIAGDDSTIMLNATTETITAQGGIFGNLTGNVSGNLTGNVTGNVTGIHYGNVIGDVSGSTTGVHTGDVKGHVQSPNGVIILWSGTNGTDANFIGYVTGDVVGNVTGDVVGNLTGDVTGDVTGNVVGNLTGNVIGNTTGYHTGDSKGSLFADDSGFFADATSRMFYGNIDLGDTILRSNSLVGSTFNIGTAVEPLNSLNLNVGNNLQLRQVLDPANGKFISQTIAGGTLNSPTAVSAGDPLGGLLVNAYTSSSNVGVAGTIGFVVDPSATIAGGDYIKSIAVISASTDADADLANATTFDSAGTVISNAFEASKYFQLPVYADDAARLAAIPAPAKGMMVFMTSGTSPTVSNKTVVFDGSSWTTV